MDIQQNWHLHADKQTST